MKERTMYITLEGGSKQLFSVAISAFLQTYIIFGVEIF